MASTSKLKDVFAFLLPKGKPNPTGTATTPGFNPTATDQFVSLPAYLDHIQDVLTSRQVSDSRQLIQDFMKFDPDVSAATNAYLTVANQKPKFLVYDQQGQLDPAGQDQLMSLLAFLNNRNDYTLGFQMNKDLYTYCEEMRYMVLMRGMIAAELVVDKAFLPVEFRLVDPKTLLWKQPSPGVYKPSQQAPGQPEPIDLDIPTFFTTFYRKDPTGIYTYSPFVSVVNTVAARQQIVNDLYRIMQISGYPRMHVKVLEEVIRKSAPPECNLDEKKMKEFTNARFAEIKATVAGMRADDIFVSSDAVEAGVMNADMPGMTINIDSVIEVLNGQNQAALKTMATIIGRGESGVNTASVEAMIFAFNADSINEPVAQMLGHLLTMMMRLQGFQGYVDVEFEKVELRPELELEPQRTQKQTRLLELLSYGLITDNEFHLELFGRPKPDEIPDMSGTGFMNPAPAVGSDGLSPTGTGSTSRPSGLTKAITPAGGNKASTSNAGKKGPARTTTIARTAKKQ